MRNAYFTYLHVADVQKWLTWMYKMHKLTEVYSHCADQYMQRQGRNTNQEIPCLC